MTIPDNQSIMLPILRLLGDRKEHHPREVVDTIAQCMIDTNVGVTTVSNYEVKKLDLDYFTEG
jgi:restriction endonuclease Mrr